MINSENDIDNLFQTNVEKFEMAPPEKAWTSLNAELDAKQAVIYKKKAYRYQLISISLSVLLISLIAFQYFAPHSNLFPDNNLKLSSNQITTTGEVSWNTAKKNITLKNTSILNQDNKQATTNSSANILHSENKVVSNNDKMAVSRTSKSADDKDSKPKNTAVSDDNETTINRHYKTVDNKTNERNYSSVSGKNNFKLASGSNTLNSEDENKIASGSSFVTGKTNEALNTLANNSSATTIALNDERPENTVNRNIITSNDGAASPIKKSDVPLIEKVNDTPTEVVKNASSSNTQGGEKTGLDSTNKNFKNNLSLTETAIVGSEVQKENEVKLPQTTIAKNDSAITKTNIFQKRKTNFDFSKLAVAAFYSPDFNCHILIDNDKNGSNHKTNYKAKDYDQREIPDFSFTAGVLLKYDLTNKWSIQSGCTYSSSVRKIKPSTIYAEQGSDSQAHYLLKSSVGITELPNSPTSIPQVGDSVFLRTNSRQVLQFINIPLIVRFQYVKNKFSYYAYSGFSANILIKEQSIVSIENPTNVTFIISNISGLRTVTCGFIFGIGTQYNFYKGFSIFTEPVFRGSITSINQNTSVTSYPCSFGLNTGISYHF